MNATDAFVNGLRLIAVLYDLITFPLYVFLQKPWTKWRNRTKVWAKSVNPGDPAGPYKKNCRTDHFFLEMNTLDNLFRRAVKIHGDKKMFGTRRVINVEETVEKNGKVLKKCVLGLYEWMTLKEAEKKVEDLARGLRHIGLNPGDKIAILAETRVEWQLIAQACFRTNITVATCYPNLGEDGLVYGINQIASSYLITSGQLLPIVQKFLVRTPKVKWIIYMEDFKTPDLTGFPSSVTLLSFSILQILGQNSDFSSGAPSSHHLALLMYTSGSTADPKGVLITHKCILSCLQGFYEVCQILFTGDSSHLAYLPLAHIYEILLENMAISLGIPIGYSSPLTMTDQSPGIAVGQCKGDINLIRPTYLGSVPLILDRIRKSITEKVEAKGVIYEIFFKFALEYKFFWKKLGFQTPILNRLLFDRFRQSVGGRLRFMTSGGAPLSPQTHNFVETCLDVDILQGYGLTETTGAGTLSSADDRSQGRVGPPLSTTIIRLADWKEGNYYATDKPYPRGEVLIGGDCVASGYFQLEDLTRRHFVEEDEIRWFYTGDIAEIHPDGCIKIIDRKKDLVKLQFGEYVSLGKIESQLKTCPLIDNVCVFGYGFLDYVIALVVPHRPVLASLAKQLNEDSLDFGLLCAHPRVSEEATRIIQKHAKSCGLMRVEIPKYVKLCTEEWLPETGFVTSAFKLRRKIIEHHYKEVIESMIGFIHDYKFQLK